MGVVEWIILAVVIVGVGVALLGWDRYRGNQRNISGGAAQPTNEVFIDPATGQQMRVWYDPSTGQREYRADGS
jgi:hypothetical protein